MPDLALLLHAHADQKHALLVPAPDGPQALPNGSLAATVALIHTRSGGVAVGPVHGLGCWLPHTPPERDPFGRPQLQGQTFLLACELSKATGDANGFVGEDAFPTPRSSPSPWGPGVSRWMVILADQECLLSE